jgi:hypothetical protein
LEQPNEILIDEKNQVNIRDLVKTINELQGRLQLIMQTILNCEGIDGNYTLSADLSKLVRVGDK